MYSKNEHYIKKNFGKEEHFRVPEDYFDTLDSRILNNIKSKTPGALKQPARTIHMWHRYRAAAVSAVASILIGGFALGTWIHGGRSTRPSSQQATANMAVSSSNLDAMMNYSMMDTEDMYSYIADSE